MCSDVHRTYDIRIRHAVSFSCMTSVFCPTDRGHLNLYVLVESKVMNNYSLSIVSFIIGLLWLAATIVLHLTYRYESGVLQLMDCLFLISLGLFIYFLFYNKCVACLYFIAVCYSGYAIAKIVESV